MSNLIELMKKIPLLIQSLLSVIVPINKQVYAETLVNEPVSNKEIMVASAPLAVSNNQDVVVNNEGTETSVNDSIVKIQEDKEFTLSLEGRETVGKNYVETKANMEYAIFEYEEEQERLRQEEEERKKAEAEANNPYLNYSVDLSAIGSGDVWSIANSLVGAGGNCLYIVNLFEQAYRGYSFSMSNAYQTSSPQPGDVIYYADGGLGVQHWAVYLGGDTALQGNYNGTTIIGSVYIKSGSSPVFYSMN